MTILTGTSGDDTLTGTASDDIIIGNDGNDTLSGGLGDDTLDGGAGNDIIDGNDGDDILMGGLDNDTLNGGTGDDIYIYASGDGNDLIDEDYAKGTDVLQFSDLNPSDINLATAADDLSDLVITIAATGETIRVDGQFSTSSSYNYGIDKIQFADSAVWDMDDIAAATNFSLTGSSDDDMLTGTAYDEIINGAAGNDTINGNGGNDTLIGGLGNDTLKGGTGSDTYIYSTGDGNDLIDEGYASGIDVLQFSDLNSSDISLATALDNLHDLVITITTTGETIRIDDQFTSTTSYNYGIDEIQFANNTIWDLASIAAATTFSLTGTSGDDTLTGTAYDEAIDGAAGNDVINGNGGHDTLTGGLGDDTLNGAAGSDTYIYSAGDGNDLIDEGYASGTDVLQFTDLNASDISLAAAHDDPNDLILSITSTGETVRIDGQFASNLSYNYGIDEIQFADSTTWDMDDIAAATSFSFTGTSDNDTLNGTIYDDTLNGGAGNDTISGNGGDDLLTSGLGNDILTGGAGADTFIFNPNEGLDTITDFSAGAEAGDIIQLEGFAYIDFNDLLTDAYESGADTIIEFDSNHTITLSGVELADLHENDFVLV